MSKNELVPTLKDDDKEGVLRRQTIQNSAFEFESRILSREFLNDDQAARYSCAKDSVVDQTSGPTIHT